MNKAVALILAIGFIAFTGLPADAKRGRGCDNDWGWNNRGRWGSNDSRFFRGGRWGSNNPGVFRSVNRWFNGGPAFRGDNGRHLGWYKNGKANRGWW